MTWAIIDQLPFIVGLIFIFYGYIVFIRRKHKHLIEKTNSTLAARNLELSRLYTKISLRNEKIQFLETRVNQFTNAKAFREGEIRQLKDSLEDNTQVLKYVSAKRDWYRDMYQKEREVSREYKRNMVRMAIVIKALSKRIKELNNEGR